MKTLLNRLKPEFKAKLASEKDDYSEMVSDMCIELTKHNWLDLPYWVICDLVAFFELPDYNPSTIANLFENE